MSSSPDPASAYPEASNEHRPSAQDGVCRRVSDSPTAPLVAEGPLSADGLDTRAGGGLSPFPGPGQPQAGPTGLVSEGRLATDPNGVGWSLRDDVCPLDGALAFDRTTGEV